MVMAESRQSRATTGVCHPRLTRAPITTSSPPSDDCRRLEHHRIGIGVARRQDVPEVPPAAEVEQHADAGQRVAEQRGKQRRPHQRVVLPTVEDIDQHGDREATTGEGRADDHVENDPDTPRVAIVEVGHRPQSEDETDKEDGNHRGDQQAADHHRQVEQLAANRGGGMMGAHCLPPFWSSSSGTTLRLATQVRPANTAIGMIMPPYSVCWMVSEVAAEDLGGRSGKPAFWKLTADSFKTCVPPYSFSP